MGDRIKAILKATDVLVKDFEEWCKDKTIPLDERWDIFMKSGFGKHHTYYWDFKTFDQNAFHDGEHVRRYETCDPVRVIDEFGKGERLEDFIDQDNYDKLVIDFKEEVLEKFIKSWNFDW